MKQASIAQRLSLVYCFGLAVWPPIATAQTERRVEILLADKLEEPRGFCLDVVGPQQRATPSSGLQAHTCYSYQGRIAVDQGFDSERLKSGGFYLPHFNVCMAITGAGSEASVMLASCNDSEKQRFDLDAAGRIVPHAESSLCLTVSAGPSVPGGGGKPPHLIRRLSLQLCDPTLEKYQKWRIREKAD